MNLRSCWEERVWRSKTNNPIDKNQNIRVRLLRQRKQKKFHLLKSKPKQPQQFTTTEKEDTSAETTDSTTLTERSYAAAAEKLVVKLIFRYTEVTATSEEP